MATIMAEVVENMWKNHAEGHVWGIVRNDSFGIPLIVCKMDSLPIETNGEWSV